MRMKTIKALSAVARWVQSILEVRLPMDAVYGLRTPRDQRSSGDV